MSGSHAFRGPRIDIRSLAASRVARAADRNPRRRAYVDTSPKDTSFVSRQSSSAASETREASRTTVSTSAPRVVLCRFDLSSK